MPAGAIIIGKDRLHCGIRLAPYLRPFDRRSEQKRYRFFG